jgi:lipopolysaccharide transport system ATP-binding protein
MSATSIRATNLSKRYELGRSLNTHTTLRESLVEGAGAALRTLRRTTRSAEATEFWALRDATFDIAHGEAVGVIGGNGAGKSTLLKILSRITAPTVGRVEIEGRVGSLLEVGTGFHPDLTGRENTFLNGAILGMRREEVARKFDEIVAFAEVERFIDTPVKRYSSGMYLRLAFAVAAHLEPEVLLVDEVLAVGDAAFQKKCLGKMSDVAGEGRTVLFVSHNMDAVLRLCSRALLLEQGHIVANDASQAVVARYLARFATETQPRQWVSLVDVPRPRTSGEARFARVRYEAPREPSGIPRPASALTVEMEIVADAPMSIGSLGVKLRSQTGLALVNADIIEQGQALHLHAGTNLVRLDIEALYLNPGRYVVSLWASQAVSAMAIDHVESALEIDVVDMESRGLGVSPRVSALVPCRFVFTAVERGGARAG